MGFSRNPSGLAESSRSRFSRVPNPVITRIGAGVRVRRDGIRSNPSSAPRTRSRRMRCAPSRSRAARATAPFEAPETEYGGERAAPRLSITEGSSSICGQVPSMGDVATTRRFCEWCAVGPRSYLRAEPEFSRRCDAPAEVGLDRSGSRRVFQILTRMIAMAPSRESHANASP